MSIKCEQRKMVRFLKHLENQLMPNIFFIFWGNWLTHFSAFKLQYKYNEKYIRWLPVYHSWL